MKNKSLKYQTIRVARMIKLSCKLYKIKMKTKRRLSKNNRNRKCKKKMI